jgi:hypothetical protein
MFGAQMYSSSTQKGPAPASGIKDASVGFRIEFAYDSLAEPVRSVVFAKVVARVAIDKFLVNALEDVFFNMAEIIITDGLG